MKIRYISKIVYLKSYIEFSFHIFFKIVYLKSYIEKNVE